MPSYKKSIKPARCATTTASEKTALKNRNNHHRFSKHLDWLTAKQCDLYLAMNSGKQTTNVKIKPETLTFRLGYCHLPVVRFPRTWGPESTCK